MVFIRRSATTSRRHSWAAPTTQMISYFIAFYASRTVNWGMAAALSIMLLTATLALYAVCNRMIGVERMRLG